MNHRTDMYGRPPAISLPALFQAYDALVSPSVSKPEKPLPPARQSCAVYHPNTSRFMTLTHPCKQNNQTLLFPTFSRFVVHSTNSCHSIVVHSPYPHVFQMSMLELYNEQLRDLLAPGGGPFDRLGRSSGAPLALQDDPRVGVRVSGLEEHAVSDVPVAMALVERGASSRSVGSTAMNEVSSRSHTIVRLALETSDGGCGGTGGLGLMGLRRARQGI